MVRNALDSAPVQRRARSSANSIRNCLIFPSAMQDLVDEQLARPRFYLVLLGLFAVLAVVLAAVGIYGVVAYVVTRRTREIGVRMALGARQREVVGLMLWQGLRPAMAGIAMGLAVAVGAGRAIQSLLTKSAARS